MLSFLYRMLTRARRRDEVTQDMLGTFEEARQDARRKGWWSYLRFGFREIGGLLSPSRRLFPRVLWIPTSAFAGMALGIAMYFGTPASYTSEAKLMMVSARVPETLTGIDDSFLESAPFKETILSRVSLTTIIRNFNLYKSALQRKPLEDVLGEMRNRIRIEAIGDSVTRIAFTYDGYPADASARVTAQRVVHDLATRFINQSTLNKNYRAYETQQFFEKRTTDVGLAWEKLNAQLRQIPPSDPRYERLALDRDLARKDYETLRQKLSAAEGLSELVSSRGARTLALLDPPSLPVNPTTTLTEMALMGFAGGLASGLLVALWRRLKPLPIGLKEQEA